MARRFQPGEVLFDHEVVRVLEPRRGFSSYECVYRPFACRRLIQVLDTLIAPEHRETFRTAVVGVLANMGGFPRIVGAPISDDGHVHLVYDELVDHSLRDLLVKERVPVDDAVQIAIDLLGSLSQLHEEGIAYGAVEPENAHLAELTADGARYALADALENLLVAQGLLSAPRIGLAEYAAPEVRRGSPPTPSSDIFSIGCLLFELVTGHVPALPRVTSILIGSAPAPRLAWHADVSRDLDQVVSIALDNDASKRQPSASAFRDQLVLIREEMGRPRRSRATTDIVSRAAKRRADGELAFHLQVERAVWQGGSSRDEAEVLVALERTTGAERYSEKFVRSLQRLGLR